MNANINPGLDRTEIIYYNQLATLTQALLQQSIQNTNNLNNAKMVDLNTTIDTTSLPPIEQCQIVNRNNNILPLNQTAQQRKDNLIAFNNSISYSQQIENLQELSNNITSLASVLSNTGILTNHSVLFNTSTTGWTYILQSITFGNELLYYLKFNANQGYIIPANNTFSIPLEISDTIVYNIPYLTELPIIDNQALKLNNAPEGVDLFKRDYNNTNTLRLNSLIPMNANDILFVFNDLEISF